MTYKIDLPGLQWGSALVFGGFLVPEKGSGASSHCLYNPEFSAMLLAVAGLDAVSGVGIKHV